MKQFEGHQHDVLKLPLAILGGIWLPFQEGQELERLLHPTVEISLHEPEHYDPDDCKLSVERLEIIQIPKVGVLKVKVSNRCLKGKHYEALFQAVVLVGWGLIWHVGGYGYGVNIVLQDDYLVFMKVFFVKGAFVFHA